MKILVTGSSGFLAKYLIDNLLIKKHKVIGIDRTINSVVNDENFREYKVDLICRNELNNFFSSHDDIDVVIHTAAVQPKDKDEDYEKYFKGNALSTFNLLDKCNRLNLKKFIFSSSFSVYGRPDKLPINENDPLKPQNVYGLSKKNAESIFYYFFQNYNFKVIILRFDGIYGKFQNLPGFINTSINLFKKDEDISIFNNGSKIRDYVYVEDASNALILSLDLINTASFEVFNIGGGEPINSFDLLSRIKNVLSTKSKLILTDKGNPLTSFNIFMNLDKAKNKLGFFPSKLENNLKR